MNGNGIPPRLVPDQLAGYWAEQASAAPIDAGPSYDYWQGTRDVSAERTPPPTGEDPNPIFSSAVTGPSKDPIVGYNQGLFGPVPIYGKASPPSGPAPSPGPAPTGPTSDASIPPPLPSRGEEGEGRVSSTTLGTAPVKPPTASAKADPVAKAQAYYGGGAPSGPSELSRGMKGLRGTYDLDKEAIARGTEAERARAEAVAVGSAALAQQKIDDQAIQQMEAQHAAQTFADYSAETQRQIDDVRTKKLNPNERYADSGSALLAIVGGVLGGLYQGLNHQEKNPFVEQMNETFRQDLAVQEKNLQTQKEGIGERRHLLAEMRGTYKDKALADLQARNLYYEGAKEAITAEAAGYDSPTIQARADQAINALSREQSKLDIQEAMRKAAAAQAAAAAAEARRKWQMEYDLKRDTHTREWAETGIKAAAAGNKRRDDERADRKEIVDKNAQFLKEHPGVPEALRLGDLIRDKNGRLDTSGEHLPEGLSKWDGIKAELLGPYLTSAAAKNNRNSYETMHSMFRHDLTGAAFKDTEAAEIRKDFDGAGTAAEKAAAIARSVNWIEGHQNLIAQHNPELAAKLGLYPAAKTPIDRREGVK